MSYDHLLYHPPYADGVKRMLREVKKARKTPAKRQAWALAKASRVTRVWAEFALHKSISEPDVLLTIADLTAENLRKVAINGLIRLYGSMPEPEWDHFFAYISDETGTARYSDMEKSLLPYELAIRHNVETHDYSNLLLAIDRAFNLIHGIGPMARWFVEGGANTLCDLRDFAPPRKSILYV